PAGRRADRPLMASSLPFETPMRTDRELTPAELEAFGAELDALRERTLADLGEADARYIRRVRGAVRLCCTAGRVLLVFGWFPPTWLLGTQIGRASCRERV